MKEIVFLFLPLLAIAFDPYQILGVSRRASSGEIKRAYKNLAKEWHPDKNQDAAASDKFMTINQAYEVLSDEKRKERYDKYGEFDESTRPSHSHGGMYRGHPLFEDFFNFNGFATGDSILPKQRVTLRMFETTLFTRSHQQPLILFAYSDYCSLCFRLEPIWKSVVEDLEPLGYAIGTVNAMTDGALVERLRITQLPAIVVIVEERILHYRDVWQARAIRIFARNSIPSTFLVHISNYDALRRFVDQWFTSNKVSVLLLTTDGDIRLRYMLASMRYSSMARFAHVHLTGDRRVEEMREALAIPCATCDSAVIFNDFPEKGPIARLSSAKPSSALEVQALNDLIDAHSLLSLPRISSEHFLNEICKVSTRSDRKLCLIFLAPDSSNFDDIQLASFRRFAHVNAQRSTRQNAKLTYIFGDKQQQFLEPFLNLLSMKEGEARNILVLWRMEENRARFIWFDAIWDGKEEEKSAERLWKELKAVTDGKRQLDLVAEIKPLMDECSISWFRQMSRRIVRSIQDVYFQMSKNEILPLLSVVGTLAVILIIGYALSYATSTHDQKKTTRLASDQDEETNENWHPEDPLTSPMQRPVPSERVSLAARQARIAREMATITHELRAETYFGLIRLLKPGCRSIILMVDAESKELLLKQFAQITWPLRNNKTFSFGYLMVEKNVDWFRKLLEMTLPVAEDGEQDTNCAAAQMYRQLKSINPRQTLGTVIVLCGWKLYFSIYHPMHRIKRPRRQASPSFLGFDDSDGDSSFTEEQPNREQKKPVHGGRLPVEDVLSGFSNWLDRLLEGSVRRYYVPEWPDNLK